MPPKRVCWHVRTIKIAGITQTRSDDMVSSFGSNADSYRCEQRRTMKNT